MTIDLFAGCGGLSLGFEREGFSIAAAYDNWDAAYLPSTYNQHQPEFFAQSHVKIILHQNTNQN